MNFFILLSAHFLADFPLQGEWMAKEKYNVFKTPIGTIALFAHAFIHALVLGTIACSLGYNFELFFWTVGVTHFFIDYGKIKEKYGVYEDQLLHCLVLLLLILYVLRA